MIRKETRDLIRAQIKTEMEFSRRYKQGKIANWQKNEMMYYGKKEKTDDARANVALGRMQEYVHTLLSKVDNPLTFNFIKVKDSQLKRVARLNSLKDVDSKRNYWDMKDIVGKKQAIIYGRAVFFYSASSDDGYKANLENCDVYDFLIDPAAGGIDVDRAKFLGRYGVIKDRYDLEGNKNYIQTEVKALLSGSGNNTNINQEEINKRNRSSLQKTSGSSYKEITDADKFIFWEWYTTYKGKKYRALITDSGHCAIQIELLSESLASNIWPVWTYAAFPDLTEFWTPSYCDYAREIFMAQEVSINQMLDNAEQINKPMKYVDVGAIQNLAELKYRKNGYVKLTPGTNGNNAVVAQVTPSITTPIQVYNLLNEINDRASGVNADAAGMADTDGKATIYEGNQANSADRFGLFNKTYAFGYQRFGHLYDCGVQEHLIKSEAIEMIGPDGVETENITRRNIYKKGEKFNMVVESSNAELALSEQKRRTQVAFLSALFNNPAINQKSLISIMAAKALVAPEELRQLLDVDNYGTAEVMSEAARDMEDLLEGKYVKPNRVADTAYQQYFVNYMQDHEEDMDTDTFSRVVQYVQSLEGVVIANMLRKAQDQARKQMMTQQLDGAPKTSVRPAGPAQPLSDVMQQNIPV